MNTWLQKVREFQLAYGHTLPETPSLLPPNRQQQRLAYMQEELDEFAEAKTVLDQTDAMLDLIYFALGTLTELGVEPDVLFNIVHNANMQKLWPDGKPRFQNGKVVKPPHWQSPDQQLLTELEKQAKLGQQT